MRKELTIEHWTAYLPHGIRAKISQEGHFNLDCEYRPISSVNDIGIVTSINFDDGNVYGILKMSNGWQFDFDKHAEIIVCLRPLSQFTKDDLLNMGRTGYDDYIERIKSGRIPYDEMQIMLSQHWDVFDLIESGLAEPISSIDQP